MNVKSWNLLLILGLLIVLSGGGYILYQNHQVKQEAVREMAAKQKAEAEEAARLAEEERVRQQQVMQDFETFLNTFLQNLNGSVGEYKTNRKVLIGLAKPENLRDETYIEENANIAESTVLSLQLQIDEIMGVFETANDKVEALIARFESAEKQDVVRESWTEMRDTQAALYIAYFESDQEILSAYLELLNFYRDHKESVIVDVETSSIKFENPELIEVHAQLQQRIRDLGNVQRELLAQQAQERESD